MRRKLLIAVAVATISTTLAACSGTGASAPDPNAKVTLSVSTWTNAAPVDTWWNEQIAGFEKEHPNITVKVNQIAYADYISTITTQETAGKGPDVVHIPTPTTTLPAWAKAGFLEDIGSWLKTTDIPATWPESQKVMTWDDKSYGVLTAAYGYTLFYNADLLKQAGVAVPKSPEELLAAAKAVQALPGNHFGFAITNDNTINFVRDALVFVTGMGGQIAQDGKWNLTSPKVVEAVNLWRTLGKSYSPQGTDIATKRNAFLTGSAGMMIEGPFYYSTIQSTASAALKPSLKMAVTPFAVSPGDVSHGLSISSGLSADHKAAAEEFIAYASSKDSLSEYAKISTTPMARPGSNDVFTTDTNTKPITDANQNNVPIVSPSLAGLRAKWSDFQVAASNSLHSLLQTDDDTASVLTKLQSQLTQNGINP